jgi:SAM-dependent methyltransferase
MNTMSHALDATPAASFSLLSRARLALKYLMWPGTNWVSRDKSRLVRMLLQGTPEKPVRTLDCGCGNAYFAHEAVKRGAVCTGITIHEWEAEHCEEMRRYLQVPEEKMSFQVTTLDRFAADSAHHGRFDQVLLLDVIEHILDAPATLRQLHSVLDEDGFVYITTPDRDWEANADTIRVSREEDGWHVRNGYTMEQLEALLDRNGFEPIDHLRFGSLGSTAVTRIQHTLFRSRIDVLTVLTFPLLKLLALALSPWRDSHTIFVLARKKRVAA